MNRESRPVREHGRAERVGLRSGSCRLPPALPVMSALRALAASGSSWTLRIDAGATVGRSAAGMPAVARPRRGLIIAVADN